MTRNIQSQHVNCGRRHLSQGQYCMSELHKHAGVPHRLRRCCDARRRAVGPARVISFYHTPWMTCIGKGSQLVTMTWEVTPTAVKMDRPFYGSKMLMGAQGHRVHLSCPVLFKQLRTKTVHRWIQHCEIPSLPWKGLRRVYQQTYIILFCSLLERLWKKKKCPSAAFTGFPKAVDVKVLEPAAMLRLKSGSIALFSGYTQGTLHASLHQSLAL